MTPAMWATIVTAAFCAWVVAALYVENVLPYTMLGLMVCVFWVLIYAIASDMT